MLHRVVSVSVLCQSCLRTPFFLCQNCHIFCGSGGKVRNGLSAIVIASQAAVAAAASCAPCDVLTTHFPSTCAADVALHAQGCPFTCDSPALSSQNLSPQRALNSSPLRPSFKIEEDEGKRDDDTACA
jgi:hypothetical protein